MSYARKVVNRQMHGVGLQTNGLNGSKQHVNDMEIPNARILYREQERETDTDT